MSKGPPGLQSTQAQRLAISCQEKPKPTGEKHPGKLSRSLARPSFGFTSGFVFRKERYQQATLLSWCHALRGSPWKACPELLLTASHLLRERKIWSRSSVSAKHHMPSYQRTSRNRSGLCRPQFQESLRCAKQIILDWHCSIPQLGNLRWR